MKNSINIQVWHNFIEFVTDLIHSLVTEVCVDDEYDEVSDEASDEPRNMTKRRAGDEFRWVSLI